MPKQFLGNIIVLIFPAYMQNNTRVDCQYKGRNQQYIN